MKPIPTKLLSFMVLLFLLPLPAFSADRTSRADVLWRDAIRRLALGTPAQRQFAREELEEAIRLAPDDSRIVLSLGRLSLEAGMLKRSRMLAEGLLARSPQSSDGHLLLGETERRAWLMDPEEVTLDRAIASLTRALRFGPRDLRCGELLVPLLIEAGQDSAALAVAVLTARSAPEDPHAAVLVACALQSAGDPGAAGAIYERAIPRLPASERTRYLELTPLLPYRMREAYEELEPSAREARATEFWRSNDPDPISEYNEARVEFDARMTRALLLYGVDNFDDLDERGRITVRFGSPAVRELQPMRMNGPADIGNTLAWTYPDLGMRVWFGASNPQGHYRSRYGSAVHAFAESLATHPELVAALGGWVTFRALPEGMEPLGAMCRVARFPSEAGDHVLAQLESLAGAAASLDADWVVLDSASAILTRGRATFGPSACGPVELRASSFDASLAPGRYQIAVRVGDGDRRRAVLRQEVAVSVPDAGLSLSDLVVVCGRPEASMASEGVVRLEPSTGLVPQSGEQLVAYGEIHGLRPTSEGERRFEYTCTVEPETRDRRSFLARLLAPKPVPPTVEVMRAEVASGDVRRQFFRVPVSGLPAGRYRVQLKVRDLVSGAESSRVAAFERR
ncbi:MAG: GWxTD domain-containing protein [Candidatus Eisenbacteria bacterium]